MNVVLQHIPVASITEANNLMYTTAAVVLEVMGQNLRVNHNSMRLPKSHSETELPT